MPAMQLNRDFCKLGAQPHSNGRPARRAPSVAVDWSTHKLPPRAGPRKNQRAVRPLRPLAWQGGLSTAEAGGPWAPPPRWCTMEYHVVLVVRARRMIARVGGASAASRCRRGGMTAKDHVHVTGIDGHRTRPGANYTSDCSDCPTRFVSVPEEDNLTS